MQKHGGMLAMTQPSENHKKYTCDDIEKLAQLYVDNRLNEQERLMFDEHLEYCLPCDKKIQFEIKLKETVWAKARDSFSPEQLSQMVKSFFSDPS